MIIFRKCALNLSGHRRVIVPGFHPAGGVGLADRRAGCLVFP